MTTPSAASPTSAKQGDDSQSSGQAKEPTTLFDWRRKRNRSLRLPFYLLVSIASLSLFFYLFQITYPVPQRTLPRTQEITLLTPSDPSAGALLKSITDRAIALALPLAPTQDGFDWNEIGVRLQPSFETHRFRPEAIAEVPDQTDLPELLAPGSLRQPKPDLPELPAAVPPDGLEEAVWTMHTGPGLEDWAVVEAPPLKPSRDLLTTLPALEFTAAVDRDGRVRHLMPLGQGDPDLERQVSNQSQMIRLNGPRADPADDIENDASGRENLTWGILRWQAGS